jgi:hypothetical protein
VADHQPVALRTGSISYSDTRIVVRYRFRLATYVLIVGSAPVVGLIRFGDWRFLELMLVLLLAGQLLDYVAVRLTADERGLRIVNYGVVSRFAWPDVASMQLVPLSWAKGAYRLEVAGRDGRRKRALVASSSPTSGYAYDDLVELVRRLDALRKHALGTADSTAAVPERATGEPVSAPSA